MQLRVEALVRFAQKTQADPIDYLEGLLFDQIDEIAEAGRVIESSIGGKTVRFRFGNNEAPGDVIMAAIKWMEALNATGATPSTIHNADFTSIDL